MEEEENCLPRKMHTMTYKEKFEIIRQMEGGKRLAKVASEFGISKSTVHYIFKKRNEIKKLVLENPVSKCESTKHNCE